MDDCIQVYKDYIYYVKKSSQSRNNLYRIKKDGSASPEKLDIGNGRFINKFIVSDAGIFYVTEPNSLYRALFEPNSETLITDRATQFFVNGDYVYYKTVSSVDVTASDFSGDIYTGKDDISFYRYDLKNNENIEILSGGVYTFGIFFNESKIFYRPLEPVNYGFVTQHGRTFENINVSNGKINALDMQSAADSTAFKAESDYFSNRIIFACDDYMIIDLQSHSKSGGDTNIYFVSTVEGNYLYYPLFQNK
jgi:hypothetical protein